MKNQSRKIKEVLQTGAPILYRMNQLSLLSRHPNVHFIKEEESGIGILAVGLLPQEQEVSTSFVSLKQGRGASGFFQGKGGHLLLRRSSLEPVAHSAVNLSVSEKGSVRAGLGRLSCGCVPIHKRQALGTSLQVQTCAVLLASHPGGPETCRVRSYCAATAVPVGTEGSRRPRRSQPWRLQRTRPSGGSGGDKQQRQTPQ